MNTIARITVVCALLLGAGGVRAVDLKTIKSDDFTEDQIGAKAFILFSTSAWQKPSMKPGKDMFLGVYINMKRAGPKDGTRQKAVYLHLDSPWETSHFAAEFAHVHWRAIEPGEYVIAYGLTRLDACHVDTPEFRITVKAGDALYLGDFFTGREQPFLLLDHYARDFGYFMGMAGGVKPSKFTPLALAPSRLVTTCDEKVANRVRQERAQRTK